MPTNAQGQPGYCPVPCPPPSGTAQSSYPSGRGPAAVAQSSGPGRLRPAGRFVDARRAYALDNSQGRPIMYVTEQPGVNLEPYLNRNVELYGDVVYRMDLRAYVMTATRVTPLP